MSRRADFALVCISCSFATYFLLSIRSHPGDSRLVAIICITVIFGCCLIRLGSILKRLRERRMAKGAGPSTRAVASNIGLSKILGVVLASVCLIATIQSIGLAILLPIYMLVVLTISEVRSRPQTLLVVAAVGVALAFVATAVYPRLTLI